MAVIETRSLMDKKLKEVELSFEMKMCFDTWYKLFVEKVGREPTLGDVFYSGYVLANPILRQQFLRDKKKDLEIEDRINYSWR